MKLTKESLREIIKEVLAETDAHPQILKKNKEQCLKTKSYSYGVLYAYIKDLPSEDIQIFHDLYNSSIKKIYFDLFFVDSYYTDKPEQL